MLPWFEGSPSLRSLLSEAFPPKQILSPQTDGFAERRSRALDAYLQILTHCLRERKLLEHEVIKDFLGFQSFVQINDIGGDKICSSSCIRTPNALNSEIEKLRLNLFKSTDLKSLKIDFDSLQEAISGLQERGNLEDLRCVEKFYEVKREWEVMKIQRGEEYDGFKIENRDIKWKVNIKEVPAEIKGGIKGEIKGGILTEIPAEIKGEIKGENMISSTKHHIREQEAILSDLAETLQQQKQVSLEICEEIIQQNRVIGEFEKRQEGTIGDFLQSTERARKLQ